MQSDGTLAFDEKFVRKNITISAGDALKHRECILSIDTGSESFQGKNKRYGIGVWCKTHNEEVGLRIQTFRRTRL